MKANKKTMFAAALAVAIIALAGVGYATVVGYKATTTVSQNSVGESQYLTIDTAGVYSGAIVGNYVFDTTNTSGTVTFTNCQKIGDNDTLTPVSAVSPAIFNKNGTTYSTEGVKNCTAYKIGQIVVTVNFANSDNKVANLAVTVDTTAVQGNGVVDLVFTKTIGSTETVIDLTDIDDIQLTASNEVASATFAAYLVTVDDGVPVATANGATLGTLPVDTTFTFVATAATASP